MAIVGNGPLPVGGRRTSTSSGTPSKLATRAASDTVGQKRAPSAGAQAWPNGAGGAALAEAGSVRSAASAPRARRRRGRMAADRTPRPCAGLLVRRLPDRYARSAGSASIAAAARASLLPLVAALESRLPPPEERA